MPIDPFTQFGWFDEVGPLWFLQQRWRCGPRWRPCWARFYAGPIGVTLQAHTQKGGFAYAGFFVPRDLWSDLSYGQKEDMVMSWLREVRRPSVGGSAGALAVDPDWLREFPALHEYLTSATRTDGTVRRTSTLTVFCETGTFKCFLNERDAGASLCASGGTVAASLSALETLLESESPPWRFSDQVKPEPRQKGRRGS